MTEGSHAGPGGHAALLHRLAVTAATRWPLEVLRIEALKVRENAVFAVHLADGARAVIRVHRRGYHSDEALRSEQTWMSALESQGIAVPRPIRSSSGALFELVELPELEGPRQVDVLEWIEGRQLGTVEHGVTASGLSVAQTYRAVGEVAAQIHSRACVWPTPAGFRRHSWDAAGLAGEQPFWGRFWDLAALSASQRRFFARLRDCLLEDLTALGTTPDRYSMIHADLVPENILVTQTGELKIIDFDDAGFGWHLFEMATSLYFIRREPYYEQARQGLLEGYRRVRAMPEEHLRLLPLFLAARGTTYLGWVHTRHGEPAAEELTPFLVDLAQRAADDYLSVR